MNTDSKRNAVTWEDIKIKASDFFTYFFSKKYFEITFIILLTSILLNLLLITIEVLIYGHPNFFRNWDHKKYIAMTQNPFSITEAPFCRRILVPLIVYILPFEFEVGFFLVAHLSLIGSAVLVYLTLKEMKFSLSLCFAGWMLFLSMSWITGFLLFDFWLIDCLAFFFIVLIFYYNYTKINYMFSKLKMRLEKKSIAEKEMYDNNNEIE